MTATDNQVDPEVSTEGMVWIDGGEFTMGSDNHYREEGPSQRVTVDGFWIDTHTVTNDQFAAFVAATGHTTFAEVAPEAELYPGAKPEDLVPGSMVFHMTEGPVDLRDYSNWWEWKHGADWRHPYGPDSNIDGLGNHPVVHVAWSDVEAYATWAGKDLPTEAEWEFAARGGLDGKIFVWGDEDVQDSEPVANTWQGRFPWEQKALDGWDHTAPVGSYPPNGFGLFDMAGNVWEWTSDWYTARHPGPPDSPCCTPANPRGGIEQESRDPNQPHIDIPRKVVKGGSHLCAKNYCFRYRPAARQPQMIDTSMTHIGFRCIIRP